MLMKFFASAPTGDLSAEMNVLLISRPTL